jgi:hypothetical protein
MAEERTISVFTLTNTPARNRQEVRTLVDQTMIRQWHQFDPKVLKCSCEMFYCGADFE